MSGDGEPRPPPPELIATLLRDPSTAAAVRTVREHFKRVAEEEVEEGALEDVTFDATQLASVLLTGCNGGATLPVQRVQVEYLRANQTMRIPQGLGINPDSPANGRAANVATLTSRMKRAAAMSYADLRKAVNDQTPYATLRATIERTAERVLAQNSFWLNFLWSTELEDGGQDTEDSANIVYTYVSQALQMNFDIRDFGALNLATMSKSDGAWRLPLPAKDIANPMPNYLRAYTLQQIAALNLPTVGNASLAAWTRAYGIGCGILPATDTATVREFKFTKMFADSKDLAIVTAFEKGWGEPLITPCLNIIAMFGLLHLSKDHTFKTGDSNMDRINQAYFKALEYVTKGNHRTAVMNYQEAIIRTGPHPFGLGQTYYVAKYLAHVGRLAPALSIRTDVTPPPVQRIMIAASVVNEWKNLPAGEDLNTVYGDSITEVMAAKAIIDASPPSYSHLAKVYGLDDTLDPPVSGMIGANTLMPCIYGFAMAVHTEDGQKKSGVALALSLDNVKKDNALLTSVWVSAWEKITDAIDREGMEGFLRHMVKSAQAVQIQQPTPENAGQ